MHNFSFFDFFPTPRFLEMPAPGLSLSDRGLHLIEFAHNKNVSSIAKSDTAIFQNKIIESGNIINTEELTRVLGEFGKKNDLHYVRASLPEERAYLFTTTIPNVSKEEIRTTIEFVIEENVPLMLSETVFDYAVMGPEEHDGRPGLKVSVSALPENVVSEYLDVFRKAGLEPLHFEIESQAITKAVTPRDDKSVSIIINLNKNKAGLYISDCGAVSFTSTIAISDPISNSFTPNLANNNQDKKDLVTNSPSASVRAIVDEIRKIFLYWQTQFDKKNKTARPIERIILVGEMAENKGLSEFFSSQFDIPLEVANVWRNAFSLHDYIPEISKKDSMSFAAAIGLALPHR